MADPQIERAKKRLHQQWLAEGGDPTQSYTTTVSYSGGGGTGSGISAEYAAARRANEMRYAQAMNIYNQIIARAQPGGAFEKAGLAQIETAKTKGVGEEMQQMISSGMYGTTTAAGIPARWETEVGAPARLRLEDVMEQRLTQAQLGKAGAIERREDVYPDVGAYAGYEAQAAAAPQQSLSDWMAQEFGTIGGGVRRPTPTAAPARKTTGRPYGGGVSTPTKVGARTPTPTFTAQPPGAVGPVREQTYTPKSYIEAMDMGVSTSWTPTKTGISPAAGYYAGIPKKIGDIKFW